MLKLTIKTQFGYLYGFTSQSLFSRAITNFKDKICPLYDAIFTTKLKLRISTRFSDNKHSESIDFWTPNLKFFV